jgi:peptidoglycan/xylan/chitin deacetylase (PgdA/CDA1 family)
MLHIVMYHYVRDLPQTAYPRIKGMMLNDFRTQVKGFASNFEMATLETTMAYLRSEYHPKRDLCLLTFDDGLKEHHSEATPILHELGIQGIFHMITGCLEDRAVAPVHMNHFLMAALDFTEYREAFWAKLTELDPAAVKAIEAVTESQATKTYPWDVAEVASFKYFFNFLLDAEKRDAIVKLLFERYIGPEKEFAEELYASWDEAREMQSAGMLIGGHTHSHRPLSSLTNEELKQDLTTSADLLRSRLRDQTLWPFCYPYGKNDSFTPEAVETLKRLAFDCAFTTEKGPSQPGVDLFRIGRVDCKAAPAIAEANEVCAQGVR